MNRGGEARLSFAPPLPSHLLPRLSPRYLLGSPPTEWDQKHKVRIAIGNGLRREIWQQFQERFSIPEIGEFYGATEGNMAFSNHSKDFAGIGAMGRAGWLQQKVRGFQIVVEIFSVAKYIH